jgi:FAD/FMN-containing dehydrogenase
VFALGDAWSNLRRRLEDVVGTDNVLVDLALTRSYTMDWTSRWSGATPGVVRPGSTAEVSGVLRICQAAGFPVVPQGGNTSLVGGSVPRGGELILSTNRLRDTGDPSRSERAIVVGAGVVLATVQERARAADLAFGVDLAARGSATVGGMAATNAGGLNVVAHGPMLDNIRGIEMVLAGGRVIDRLGRLPKDTAGYDLMSLFVGSEGTLGVITRLRLGLVTRASHRAAALLAVDSVADAVSLAAALPAALPRIRSLELILEAGMELVCRHARLARPFLAPHACYLLVEVGGTTPVLDEFASVLAERSEIADDVVAVGNDEVDALFLYREGQTEAIRSLGVPSKFDVAVPLDRVEAFLETLEARLSRDVPGARCIAFGHLAEGNLHVNVLPPAGADEAVEELVLGLVLEMAGTISAEHGIGIAKAAWLQRMRGPADVAAMRSLKAALDPAGIMNPGVLFAATETGPR